MTIDFQEGAIDPSELEADPLLELGKWYDLAKASDDMLPEAMSLAEPPRLAFTSRSPSGEKRCRVSSATTQAASRSPCEASNGTSRVPVQRLL